MRLKFSLPAIIVFVFTVSSQAQIPFKNFSASAIYSLSYQIDSTDPASEKKEIMVLLLGSNESLFMAYNKFLYDSASYRTYLKTGSRFGDMKMAMTFRTPIMYGIVKKGDKIFTYDKIQKNMFLYEESLESRTWKIEQDTLTIAGIQCQKANLNFGGRKWIAWFAPSIPISDGPYKFQGLPGLIINIYDADNSYNFKLISLVNYSGEYLTVEQWEYVRISKKQFFKAAEEYKRNQFQMDQLSGVKFTSGQDAIKKRLEELAKKNNNPIELRAD